MLDFAQQASNHKLLVKQNWLPIALGLIGLTFFIYGLISLLGMNETTSDLTLEPAKSATTETQKVIVDVEGAVVNPGVYKLETGARVQDALITAGGLTEKADRDWVEKNLNLAAKLSDTAKLYIPRAGELQNETKNLVQEGVIGTDVLSAENLINVNTATISDLDTLPGIGEVTAEKIISNRPYGSIDELLSKKAVSSKVFSQIKDKVTVR
jgi:competence protein ComEA